MESLGVKFYQLYIYFSCAFLFHSVCKYNATDLITSKFCQVHPVTVKILKFGTPQTIAITVLKKEKFDVTLH